MSTLSTLREKLRDFRRPKPMDVADYVAKLKARGLSLDGKLIPDPTPIAPPIGYVKTPSMVEIVRDMVRSHHLAAAAQAAGQETFEEAEDFDIPDDPVQLPSPYENEFDPPLSELLKAGAEVVASKGQKPPQEGAGGEGKPGGSTDKPPAPPAPPEAPKAE